jgi:hypothetical protein
MRIIFSALSVVVLLGLVACGDDGDDGTDGDGSSENTGAGAGDSSECVSNSECINGACQCLTEGREGESCGPTVDDCESQCEVCN